MKKNALLSAVLAVALFPAVGLPAEQGNSFLKDAQICDSWSWQDDAQSNANVTTSINQLNKMQMAFGDYAQNGIGW